MTMLPSLMLWHMIFAESLAAILTFLVLRCYTSTFIAFFQMSKPAPCEWFKLELGLGPILGYDSTLRSVPARVSHDRWRG